MYKPHTPCTFGPISLFSSVLHVMKPVLALNAKPTEHIHHIQGIGRLKLIDVANLWIQDEVRSNKNEVVRRVKR